MHARADEGLPDSLWTSFLSKNEGGVFLMQKKIKKNATT